MPGGAQKGHNLRSDRGIAPRFLQRLPEAVFFIAAMESLRRPPDLLISQSSPRGPELAVGKPRYLILGRRGSLSGKEKGGGRRRKEEDTGNGQAGGVRLGEEGGRTGNGQKGRVQHEEFRLLMGSDALVLV